MKCMNCNSNNTSIDKDTPVEITYTCNHCHRDFKISKVSIGKRSLLDYLDIVKVKCIGREYVCIEARGKLIPKMQIIGGIVVKKDKIAELFDVDVLFSLDEENKIVTTERLVLKSKIR